MTYGIDDTAIRYDVLFEGALRGLVRDVLADVAEHGLPGEHHFYITFRTNYVGSIVPERLLAKYPEQMTIVLQHQFSNLKIFPDRFSIKLSFGGVPGELVIPLASITVFADPHANFTLQFTPADNDEGASDGPPAHPKNTNDEDPEKPDPSPPPGSGTVVSLDKFRKK